MRNSQKTVQLWMLSALCTAALVGACSAESVNPQPLPPEDDGTGSENGGSTGPTGGDNSEDPTSAESDAGASGDGGNDSGESEDAGATDASDANDGDHG